MSYTVYSSRCLIREFQTGLREDPESMLYVLLVLMYTLSLIFLSFHLFDLSTTCVAPQSMLWFVLIQWVALAFRTSPVATALLCSLILVFKGLHQRETFVRTPHCVNVLLTFVTCSIKHLFCTAVGRSGLADDQCPRQG